MSRGTNSHQGRFRAMSATKKVDRRKRTIARDRKRNGLSGMNDASPTSGTYSRVYSWDFAQDSLSASQQDSPRRSSAHRSKRHHSPIDEHSRISLLRQLLSDSHAGTHGGIRRYAQELGLLSPCNSASPDEPERIEWTVQHRPISELELPKRYPHSGSFEWIGRERDRAPTYLWDSKEDRSVFADAKILKEGYIAVSWTWGRFRAPKDPKDSEDPKGSEGPSGPEILNDSRKNYKFRPSKSVKWELPVHAWKGQEIDLIRPLKRSLKKVPGCRYFWVDVLCVHQQDNEQKKHEIRKQAHIFGGAKGVLCFLWDLQSPEDLSKPLEGLGQLVQWALNFGESIIETGDIDSYENAFERLRGVNWFTSLWALQEIVLAPAGIWMTRNGDICQLNGQVLTTRLMAMILRVLYWADRHRDKVWQQAENDYRAEKGLSRKEFERFQGRYRKHQLEARRALRNKISQPRSQSPSLVESQRRSSSSAFSLSWMPLSWWGQRHSKQQLYPHPLPPSPFDKPPWIIRRKNAEKGIRKIISQWTNWAFGTVCIDVALSATRAAIIVAATNRGVSHWRRREPALLAALKIAPEPNHPLFDDNVKEGGVNKHLDPLLLNAIIATEDSSFFNVAHSMDQPQMVHRCTEDFIEVEYCSRDDTVGIVRIHQDNLPGSSWLPLGWPNIFQAQAETHRCNISTSPAWQKTDRRQTRLSDLETYEQQGIPKFVRKLPRDGSMLSDVSPDTASTFNLEALPFDSSRSYIWYSCKDWHVHKDGGLHVPFGTGLQKVVEPTKRMKNKFPAAKVLLNGSEGDAFDIYSIYDLNHICNTQKWLGDKLGTPRGKLKAKFLFLPLGFRDLTRTVSSSSIHSDFTRSRNSIGVLLVAQAKCSKDQSMTCWHKIGTYTGTSAMEDAWLDWNDGIIVTSFKDKPKIQSSTGDDCEAVKQDLNHFFRGLPTPIEANGHGSPINENPRTPTVFTGRTPPVEVPWKRKLWRRLCCR